MQGTIAPTIALRPAAVFQLLLFASSEQVRDAAARLLEPAISVPAEQLRLIVGDFSAIPRSQQVAARLVASAIARDRSSAVRFLALDPRWGSLRTRDGLVFVHETPMHDPLTRRIDGVFENFSWFRVAFTLPATVEETALALRNARDHADAGSGRRVALWDLEDGVFRIGLPDPSCPFKGTKHWRPIRLYSPAGVLVKQARHAGKWRSPFGGFELDTNMLLRLEAGCLRGHVVECMSEDPYPRSDRARHCVISVECGASTSDPPAAVTLVGDLEPRYPIDELVRERNLAMPLLGGATIESLDCIARRVGVWHGDSVRGSFAYHPLRSSAQREVA